MSEPTYRTDLMQSFEDVLYGPWPEGMPVSWGEPRRVESDLLGGKGRLEEIPVTIGTGEGASQFWLAVAIPAGEGPFPLVISQTFSSNCAAFPGYPVTSPAGTPCEGSEMDGTFGYLATQIFGTYIAKVPLERFMDAGIAYATFYGSDFVPDRRNEAPDVMEHLGGPINPTSTLMARGSSAWRKPIPIGWHLRPKAGWTGWTNCRWTSTNCSRFWPRRRSCWAMAAGTSGPIRILPFAPPYQPPKPMWRWAKRACPQAA